MIIEVNGTITISNKAKTIFDYISNLENDRFWRKEINYTLLDSKPGINTKAIENSFLSRKAPNHLVKLICSDYIQNRQIVYQTFTGAKYFLKSERKIELLSENETKVHYTIKFDKSIVKQGLGFDMPKFIVQMAAKNDMKKYLATLKTILETSRD
ncbi:MAG: hypothetical protein EOP53_02455 [Sphingobacteriales bacterium]|nr:MAG: hypothetical protein EOP53_02455 [Sphingobacteriales bacterium]